MLETYPRVHDEFETIKKVLRGFSLSRFGDGELKIIHGAGYSREKANRNLTAELLDTFLNPDPKCIIGIPTMNPEGPKYANWLRHEARFLRVLTKQRYYSAFVTRPDSAPWISTPEYAQYVQRIWAGKHAVVLCEQSGSMIKTVRMAAKSAAHIMCPREGAYARIDKLEERILDAKPDVAILACGPTASILANRLCKKGVHTVDLGSAGQFLGKLL